MSNKTTKNTLACAVGAAMIGSLTAVGSAAAAENPFGMTQLESGYMQLAMNEGKCGGDKAMKEGKCGEGKCGADKAKTMKEGKCGEGKCGGDKAKSATEGKCGGDKAKPAMEGKCGGGK